MSRSGIASVRLPAGARMPAARSGVRLGLRAQSQDPLIVRMFRQSGTTIAAAAAEDAVRLLVLRAAGAGAAVRVVTPRPGVWRSVLRGRDAHAVAPTQQLGAVAGPLLLVDDRPGESRQLGGSTTWRCRIDVRAPGSAADMRALAQADVLLLGVLEPDLALAATSSLAVSLPSLAQLTGMPRGMVAVLRRRGIEFVSLDPTDGELAALRTE